MACQDCLGETPKSYTYYQSQTCLENPCKTGNPIDADCVIYNSANLPCANVVTGDSIKDALQKIDSKLCQTTGDYSTYNINCLAQDGAITTEGQFVSRITSKVCSLSSSLTTFLNSTFPNYQAQVAADIAEANKPYLTCVAAGVISSDDTKAVLGKYCSTISSIKSSIDVTGIDWTQCFSTGTPPTNVKEAFALVEQQICLIKQTGASGALPTFNNIGSCLPAPLTSNDTLYDTVEKIKTRLCQSPTFSVSKSWGCVSQPSTIDLDSTIQSMINKISDNSKAAINQVTGATLEYIDPNTPCLGKKLTITGGVSTDRLVAASAGDNSPGTLAEKLEAGDGISIDTSTDVNKANISTDGKLLTSSTDETRGFLVDKLEQDPDAAVLIEINGSGTDDQIVNLGGRINSTPFLSQFFDALEASPVFRGRLCALIAACGSGSDLTPVNVGYGPSGESAAYFGETVYATVPMTTDGDFTIGSQIYVDASGTTPVHDARYFFISGGSYHYAEVVSGTVMSVGTVANEDMEVIGTIVVSYNASSSPACNAPRTLVMYSTGLTLGLTHNGDMLYKDPYFEEPAEDGYYTYTSGHTPVTVYSSFQIVSGVVTGSAAC